MKTLYMETTKKEPEETGAEIEALLRQYGLRHFNKEYDGSGEIIGCYFVLSMRGKDIPIKLPINWLPLWRLAEHGETRYIRDQAQAQRVAWRQVLRWIEAQLAIVDIGMVDIAEVFLPYMLINKKTTLYQHLVANNMKLIEAHNADQT